MEYKKTISKLIIEAAAESGYLDGLHSLAGAETPDFSYAALIEAFIETPPSKEMGDYALPCFKLSKALREPPQKIAQRLSALFGQRLSEPAFSKYALSCRADGGFFNIFVNRAEYVGQALTEILQAGVNYGSSDIGAGKRVLVEFSAPNIAKPFHVGHLCSTVIGGSIVRLYKYLGYDTVSINHLGDWGTQFGKLISAYRRWGDHEALAKDPIDELLRVYVRFHKEVKEAPELDEEARNLFLQLEEGEPGVVGLWKEFYELSMVEFEKIYKKLDITFDAYNGESFYSDKMGEIVELLAERGLLKESDGARIVDLSEFGLTPCIILKSDGATIYATRDLAAALYRKRTYDFYKCIYEVGLTQSLHFKQVFAVLKLMGFEWSSDCVHVGHGNMRLPGGKMATREGNVVALEGILDESVKRAAAMMDMSRGLDDPERTAEAIGVGAVVYAFLKNNRERDSVFSWDELLDLEGDSGPYLQYTCARASSVLRKAGGFPERADYTALIENEEFELAGLLSLYPGIVLDAANKYEPSILSRHIHVVARAFNRFYNAYKILDSAPAVRDARLHLCKATRDQLVSGLSMLGIKALDRM